MSNQGALLSKEDMDAIHETSVRLLEEVGIDFPCEAGIEIFDRHGIRTDGSRVFLHDMIIEWAVEQAPSQFVIQARNPDRNVVVGNGEPVFVPGYGAPFIIDLEQGQRPRP